MVFIVNKNDPKHRLLLPALVPAYRPIINEKVIMKSLILIRHQLSRDSYFNRNAFNFSRDQRPDFVDIFFN